MAKNNIKARLQAFIDALPAKPLPFGDGGGWVKPDPVKFKEFYELMYDLSRYYFGVDCDNSSCVILSLTDRTRFEKNSFFEKKQQTCKPWAVYWAF